MEFKASLKAIKEGNHEEQNTYGINGFMKKNKYVLISFINTIIQQKNDKKRKKNLKLQFNDDDMFIQFTNF